MKVECFRCKKRKGVLDYSDSYMSYTHGFVNKICRECYIDILDKSMKEIQKTIKEQKKLLNGKEI